MLDAALEYAARGWPAFPLEPGGKRPLGRLAQHGLKDATTDLERIRAWWGAEPEANIGLPTGLAFDVLDVDGDEGWRSLAYAVAEHGCLSSAPVAGTPSGGAHYLFRPTGLGNRAGFLPGLDWRGVGGYIVAAPSVGANGTRYEWLVGLDEVPLVPVPPWLVDLLEHKAAAQPVPNGAGVTSSGYGRRALEGEVGKVLMAPEGTRNHALNAAAFSLGQLVAGRALGVDEVINALLLAAERVGLGTTEARATIASGLKAGSARPRSVAS